MIRSCRAALAVPAVVALSLAATPASAASYREEVLPNGLRVILVEHRANPMICSSVVVGAGVVHEPEGMNGASHFLEHLLFNGTESRSQRELYDEVDRLGAYNNATTREDHTLFTLLIQREFAEHGLAIQADMLFHSTLPPDKFEKEKGVVLEELARDRNDPAYLASEAFRAFAYAGTPLARPVLGTEASIRGLKRDDVLAYYRARYVPRDMVLLVMGDFDASSMIETVKRTFGAAPQGPAPAPSSATWPPAPSRRLATRPLDAGRTYVHAAFPLSVEPCDPRMDDVEVLLSALSDGDDAPLARTLTGGADPMVLSFSLEAVPRSGGWSSVEFEAAIPKGRSAAPVLAALWEGLRSLAPRSPAWERIPSVRSSRRSDESLTADNIQYYGMTRSAYLLGSPRDYVLRRLEEAGPAGSDLEGTARMLRESFPRMRAVVVGPGLAEGAAEWEPPAPASPASAGAPDTATETLPSGLIAWARRNDDSPVFAAHLMLRPRSASEPAGKAGIADFLHRMLLRGSIVRDAASLSATLDSLGARIKLVDDPSIPYDDYYTTPEYSFARLEMPADRWREGIALLAEIVRFPGLAEEDVAAVRKEMLDLQRQQSESARAVAQRLLSETLAPGQPLAAPVLGTPESVSTIGAADLEAFHKAYVGGKRMILTAVGPVDPKEVIDAARGAFRDLGPGADLPVVTPAPVTPPGKHAEGSVGKGQAQIVLAALFDADPADEPALAVAGALLSDRLSFRLREERGLAYSISASVAPWGGRTKLEVSMGTRQANVEEALAGLREGIAEFVASSQDGGKVERAVNALRGRLLMRRMTRINQAYFAGLDLLKGRDPGDDLRRLDLLRSVRPADVERVTKRYLDPARCATVIVR